LNPYFHFHKQIKSKNSSEVRKTQQKKSNNNLRKRKEIFFEKLE